MCRISQLRRISCSFASVLLTESRLLSVRLSVLVVVLIECEQVALAVRRTEARRRMTLQVREHLRHLEIGIGLAARHAARGEEELREKKKKHRRQRQVNFERPLECTQSRGCTSVRACRMLVGRPSSSPS